MRISLSKHLNFLKRGVRTGLSIVRSLVRFQIPMKTFMFSNFSYEIQIHEIPFMVYLAECRYSFETFQEKYKKKVLRCKCKKRYQFLSLLEFLSKNLKQNWFLEKIWKNFRTTLVWFQKELFWKIFKIKSLQ